MHQIFYHIGFNAFDSSILIGKTKEEADIFIKENTVLFIGVGELNTGIKYPIYEIRIIRKYMTKCHCPQRLNVYVDDDEIICGYEGIG